MLFFDFCSQICFCVTFIFFIAARALATYLIPGCVGRGVRLGSGTSSGGGASGGVWKSGNLEIWEFGDLGTWKSGKLEIWGPGNPEMWGPKNPKNKNSQNSIHSTQDVGKVWISRKNSSRPHLGPSEAILSMDWENPRKCMFFAYFPWWANGPYSPCKETRAHCNG